MSRVSRGPVRAAALLACLVLLGCDPPLTERRTFVRPDGKYKVVVYSTPNPVGGPGQGSDAPGVVRLFDRDGKQLAEARVGMVKDVEKVEWDGKRCVIKLVADRKSVV